MSVMKSILSRRSLFRLTGLGLGAWIGGRLVPSALAGGQLSETTIQWDLEAIQEARFKDWQKVLYAGREWTYHPGLEALVANGYQEPYCHVVRLCDIENGTHPFVPVESESQTLDAGDQIRA